MEQGVHYVKDDHDDHGLRNQEILHSCLGLADLLYSPGLNDLVDPF